MVPQLACSCIKCVPLSPPVTNDTRSKKKSVINEASYLDTLSAAVDLMQGVKLEEFVGRPVDGPQIELPEFLKKEALKCEFFVISERAPPNNSLERLADGTRAPSQATSAFASSEPELSQLQQTKGHRSL